MPARSSASVFYPSLRFRCWLHLAPPWRPAPFSRCCSRPSAHQPPEARMRSIYCAAIDGTRAPAQMIWLPGAYHAAQDFIDEGFARAAAQRRAPLDLLFVDLEMEHLDDRA